jgi:hypothetical protein
MPAAVSPAGTSVYAGAHLVGARLFLPKVSWRAPNDVWRRPLLSDQLLHPRFVPRGWHPAKRLGVGDRPGSQCFSNEPHCVARTSSPRRPQRTRFCCPSHPSLHFLCRAAPHEAEDRQQADTPSLLMLKRRAPGRRISVDDCCGDQSELDALKHWFPQASPSGRMRSTRKNRKLIIVGAHDVSDSAL